ncbi:MAG: DNA primase, partial [Alphaproteobacteria bacterium]|nr:DNA primase [Alphaproteobacteria bacterium]
GREYKGCCPFHNEKTPSFYVNDDKGFYHCFGCSAHGDAIKWLTTNQGLPFIDAVKELAAAAGMALPAPDPRAAERARAADSLHDVMAAAAEWFATRLSAPEGSAARAYLDKRGITPPLAREFGLGFAPDERGALKAALAHFGEGKLIEAGLLILVENKESYDRFRGRLMIPIKDARGRVIAFGGRILGSGEPKYLNSPDTPLFDKGRTLYNLDRAGPASRNVNRVIIVEGYMDVIALAKAGIDEVVAPLGTALTEHQLQRLWRLAQAPILCFDGDAAGQKAAARAALRALPMAAPKRSLQFVSLPQGQDPDDLVRGGGRSAVDCALAQPQPLVAQLWAQECAATPLTTPEARAGLKQRLEDLASSIIDPLTRDEYRRTFRNLSWEKFGWKRGERGGMRTYETAARPADERTTLARAVLIGLQRYPDVLRETYELVARINFPPELRTTHRLLLEAGLSESIINTDHISEMTASLENPDSRSHLGYAFACKPGKNVDHKQAEEELKLALRMLAEVEESNRAWQIARAKLAESLDDESWQIVKRLKIARETALEARRDWNDAADNGAVD